MLDDWKDRLEALLARLGDFNELVQRVRDTAAQIPAYVDAAWTAVQYLYEPKTAAVAAMVALLVLILRVFFGGKLGALVRLVVYVGLGYLLANYDGFTELFSDEPEVAPMVAATVIVCAWLPLTLLGGLIRLFRGGKLEPVAVGSAGTGEAFNVRRNEKENKQLVVIMMTDIVGYSARMEKNEAATYELLKEHNIIMRKAITTNRGREIKTIGDAFMVVFQTPIDALRCAIAMQKGLYAFNKPRPANDQLKVRIGLYQGEATVTEKDVFGETVNIAARMESITEPGGISVSANIYEAVKGKIEVGFQSIGIPKMKNIAKPPEVYRVHVAHA